MKPARPLLYAALASWRTGCDPTVLAEGFSANTRPGSHVREGGTILPAVDVAGDPFSDEILLGRNVLNQLDLRLEGPALRTHFL